MEIILLAKAGRRHRRRHLGPWAVRGLGLLVVAAVAGAAFAGYRLSGHSPDPAPDLYRAAWAQEVLRQRAEVRTAVDDAENGITALAARLGQMQSRVIRLDALGSRLVEMAGLDEEEFRFGQAPALGGPRPAGADERVTVEALLAELEALDQRLADRAPMLATVETALMNARLAAEVHPAGKPVAKGWISSRFGWRTDPVTGKRSMHEGIDFASPRNSEVLAVAAGVVTRAGRRGDYGRIVELNHGKGYVTRYAHNQKLLVKAGDRVSKGDVIALVGSSGQATGPHVHFEVLHKGRPLNPIRFVRGKK